MEYRLLWLSLAKECVFNVYLHYNFWRLNASPSLHRYSHFSLAISQWRGGKFKISVFIHAQFAPPPHLSFSSSPNLTKCRCVGQIILIMQPDIFSRGGGEIFPQEKFYFISLLFFFFAATFSAHEMARSRFHGRARVARCTPSDVFTSFIIMIS